MLFEHLKQRLPVNLNILKNNSVFSWKILKPVKDFPSICKVMKLLCASDKTAEYQINKINLVDLKNKDHTEFLEWGKHIKMPLVIILLKKFVSCQYLF